MIRYEKRNLAKQYLSQYRYLFGRCERLKREIDNQLSANSSSIIKRPDKHHETRINSAIARYVNRMERYYAMLADAEDVKSRIYNEVMLLDDLLERAILEKYYCEGKRLEQIAIDMNYCFSWIRKKHLLALEHFYEAHLITWSK